MTTTKEFNEIIEELCKEFNLTHIETKVGLNKIKGWVFVDEFKLWNPLENKSISVGKNYPVKVEPENMWLDIFECKEDDWQVKNLKLAIDFKDTFGYCMIFASYEIVGSMWEIDEFREIFNSISGRIFQYTKTVDSIYTNYYNTPVFETEFDWDTFIKASPKSTYGWNDVVRDSTNIYYSNNIYWTDTSLPKN